MRSLRHTVRSLLGSSSRIMRTDMRYLAGGGFWLVMGQFGAALTAFTLSLVVARYLPQEVYGSYKYILSLTAIIGALTLTGLGTTIGRAVALGYHGALRRGFYRSLRASALMLVVFFAVALYYMLMGAYALAACMAIAGLATPLINGGSLFNAYWSGRQDFRRQTAYWTVTNVAATGALIVTILVTGDLVSLIAAFFVVSAATNIGAYYLSARRLPQDEETDQEREATSGAGHQSILNFLGTLSGNIDKIIVFQFLGTAHLAVYAFSLALPDQLRAMLKSGARLAFPRFATREFSDIQETLGGRLLRFGVLITLVAASYALVAPVIFPILFPTYVESVPYTQVLALSLFTVLATVPMTALQAHAKHQELYIHAILTNVLQITSGILLMLMFGLWGAIWSVILNRVVHFGLAYYLFRRS